MLKFLFIIIIIIITIIIRRDSVLWHCWLGDRKGVRPVKCWVMVVTICLELCTSYSSRCYHHLHHP